jgi:hypothetical protein
LLCFSCNYSRICHQKSFFSSIVARSPGKRRAKIAGQMSVSRVSRKLFKLKRTAGK